MTRLNEYLGGIISSITNARVISDIQSVKIAEEYAKHPLLKHFAVPRMRIGDVELTIPVALDNLESQTDHAYEPINNKTFNVNTYKELLANLGIQKMPVSLSRKMLSKIASETERLESRIKKSKDTTALEAFAHAVVLHLNEDQEGKAIIKKNNIDLALLESRIRDGLSREIAPYSGNAAIEHLNIIAESDKLREKSPESLVYIKMNISESGMEWHRMESGKGETESKLLPE